MRLLNQAKPLHIKRFDDLSSGILMLALPEPILRTNEEARGGLVLRRG